MTAGTKSALLRLATCIILLTRAVGHQAPEPIPRVLLVRRTATLRFMGGFSVFPGGVKDDADADLSVAALRELHEETGLVFSTYKSQPAVDGGVSCTVSHSLQMPSPSPSPSSFLQPWARWLTPPQVSTRFDTLFFLSLVDSSPPASALALNRAECDVAEWLTASEALHAHQSGRVRLAPPTWLLLRELSQLGSADVIAAEAERRRRNSVAPAHAVITIEPQLVPLTNSSPSKQQVLLLPGDHQYEAVRTGRLSTLQAEMREPGAVLRRLLIDTAVGRYQWQEHSGSSNSSGRTTVE